MITELLLAAQGLMKLNWIDALDKVIIRCLFIRMPNDDAT